MLEGMPKRHEKEKYEKRDLGDHFSNLFDEDNDQAGERIDPATGKPINNSPVVDGADEQLSIIEPGGGNSEDALGALPNEDTAEELIRKWNAENN